MLITYFILLVIAPLVSLRLLRFKLVNHIIWVEARHRLLHVGNTTWTMYDQPTEGV